MAAAGRRIFRQALQGGPTVAIGIADRRGERFPTMDGGSDRPELPEEFPEPSPHRPGLPTPIQGTGMGLQGLPEVPGQGIPRPSGNAGAGRGRQQGQALEPRPGIAGIGQFAGAALQLASPSAQVLPAGPGTDQLQHGPHPFEFPTHPMDGRIIKHPLHPGTGAAGPFAEQSRQCGLGGFPGGNAERHALNLGHGPDTAASGDSRRAAGEDSGIRCRHPSGSPPNMAGATSGRRGLPPPHRRSIFRLASDRVSSLAPTNAVARAAPFSRA